MILRLDDDDDEAEREIRMDVERQAAEEIQQALENQQEEISRRLRGVTFQDFTDVDLEPSEDELKFALQRALSVATDLGVSVAVSQFENVGIAFDWTLANARAREAALEHAGDLIAQINATTQRRLQTSVTAWIDSGAPLDDLIADLAPVFGRDRAELVSSTEVTRAFAEGNILSYMESGLVSGRPEKVPPSDTHPRCRCWLVLKERDDETWVYLWQTARDEFVCPICGPLHNQEIAIA